MPTPRRGLVGSTEVILPCSSPWSREKSRHLPLCGGQPHLVHLSSLAPQAHPQALQQQEHPGHGTPDRDQTFPVCPPAHKQVGLWHGMGSHLCHHMRCHGNGQELR